MLEKLWVENIEIPIQLVYNIMNKSVKTTESIPPTVDGQHNPKLRKVVPKRLLDHLVDIRARALIKQENK